VAPWGPAGIDGEPQPANVCTSRNTFRAEITHATTAAAAIVARWLQGVLGDRSELRVTPA
jgi:hypothetical protein